MLRRAIEKFWQERERRLERATAHLRPKLVLDRIGRDDARVKGLGQLLESLSYRNVLERGFVLVRDAKDRPVTRAASVAPGMRLALGFADGTVPAVAEGASATIAAEGGGARPAGARSTAAGKPRKPGQEPPQGSLL